LLHDGRGDDAIENWSRQRSVLEYEVFEVGLRHERGEGVGRVAVLEIEHRLLV
jgi:hypothetical protein